MLFKKYVSAILSALTAVLILMSFVSCDGSNSPEISEQSFKVSERILQDYFIISIAFDSKGAAWLGTFRQGLIKYENNSAVIYNFKDYGLPDETIIYDLAIDHKNNVWLGSDYGLIKYDHKKFTLFNKTNSDIAEDVVWSIAVDENNVLWLASCWSKMGGLVKFDEKNWTLYTPQNSKMPINLIRDIIVDNRNSKWINLSDVINKASIAKLSGDKWEIFDKDNMGFTPFYFGNLTTDNRGNLYASIDYQYSSAINVNRPQIIKYDGENWTINNPVDENGNCLGYVKKIRMDK